MPDVIRCPSCGHVFRPPSPTARIGDLLPRLIAWQGERKTLEDAYRRLCDYNGPRDGLEKHLGEFTEAFWDACGAYAAALEGGTMTPEWARFEAAYADGAHAACAEGEEMAKAADIGVMAIEELRDKLIDALWREFLGYPSEGRTRHLAELRECLGMVVSSAGDKEPPANPRRRKPPDVGGERDK